MAPAVEYEKKSITMPTTTVEEVNRYRGVKSFSAFMADAAQVAIQQAKLSQLVDELEAEYGPCTPEELEQARLDLML